MVFLLRFLSAKKFFTKSSSVFLNVKVSLFVLQLDLSDVCFPFSAGMVNVSICRLYRLSVEFVKSHQSNLDTLARTDCECSIRSIDPRPTVSLSILIAPHLTVITPWNRNQQLKRHLVRQMSLTILPLDFSVHSSLVGYVVLIIPARSNCCFVEVALSHQY